MGHEVTANSTKCGAWSVELARCSRAEQRGVESSSRGSWSHAQAQPVLPGLSTAAHFALERRLDLPKGKGKCLRSCAEAFGLALSARAHLLD